MDEFSDEREMNTVVRSWIDTSIIPKLTDDFVLLLSDKSFDIPICKNGRDPRLFFIELKCHQSRHARLGIGHGKGGGFQVEILKEQVDYFERFLRWLLAYPERYPGEFLFLTSEEVRRFLSGGRVGRKFNNIRLSIFEGCELKSADDLQAELLDWLDSA